MVVLVPDCCFGSISNRSRQCKSSTFQFLLQCCLIMTFKYKWLLTHVLESSVGWADVGPASGLQCRRWAGVGRSTLLPGECDCMYFKWHFICTYLYNVMDCILFHWCVIHHAVIYHPAFYLEFYVCIYIYIYAYYILQCVACWNFMYSYVLCQKWRIKHVQSLTVNVVCGPPDEGFPAVLMSAVTGC